MKKIIVFVISIILITSGILIGVKYTGEILKGAGALQVNANIKSKIYLDDKYIGDTPLCKCTGEDKIKTGNYSLKIVPDDKNFTPFTQRLDIGKDVLAFVERTFLPGSFANAYILTLEKIGSEDPELLIASIPQGSLVSIDNNPQGVTPLLINKTTSTEHEIEVSRDGFTKKTIIVKPVAGYRLAANIILGAGSQNQENTSLIPQPSVSPQETASASSQLNQKSGQFVKILSTPVNFLRVREEPSVTSNEISKVYPDETYPLLSEKEGWFQIRLSNGSTGWISSEYSETTNTP